TPADATAFPKPALLESKCQVPRLHDSLEPDDSGKGFLRHITVDFDKCDRVATRLLSTEMEGGDVVPLHPKKGAEPPDKPWLVAIRDIQHVGSQLRLHVDALYLDDARLAVGEDGPGDRPVLLFRDYRQANVALIGARLLAASFLDADATLLRERR